MIKTFRDLVVWQKSMNLVTKIYSLTKNFPHEELFGLTTQIRRSAISIPLNIAEGYGRKSSGDYIRFLQIAMGSLFELETQLEITLNLKFLSLRKYNDINQNIQEIERMLSSLIRKIK